MEASSSTSPPPNPSYTAGMLGAISDSARSGASLVYNAAHSAAVKTKMTIQEAYLMRQTKMEVNFVPPEIVKLLNRLDEASEILQEVALDMRKRAQFELEGSKGYLASTKCFTSLAYVLQQSTEPTRAHAPVLSLSESYDKIKAECETYAKCLEAVAIKLLDFVEEDMAEVNALRKSFDERIQEVHIARMRVQAIRAQQSADPTQLAAAEQQQTEAEITFEGGCHQLIAKVTEILRSFGSLLEETMAIVLSAEKQYAASRLAAISQSTETAAAISSSFRHSRHQAFGTDTFDDASEMVGLTGDLLVLPMRGFDRTNNREL